MRHNTLAIAASVGLQLLLSYTFYLAEPLHSKWLLAWGLDAAKLQGENFQPYFVSIMGAIVMAYCNSWLVQKLDITEWVGGLGLGVVLWVGFMAPLLLAHYRLAQVSPQALFIDATRDLLAILLSCVLLALWRAK